MPRWPSCEWMPRRTNTRPPWTLGVLPIKGKVITGDAMFTHRDFCAQVIEGGDSFLPVKENQPTLLANIAAVFAEPEAGLSPPPGRVLRSRDRPSIGD